ncbi:MAG: hypothetical protein KDA64_15175, partial [Rhodospirillaceae bacterium]|nr:hypothetical protein [Rhodospirillaceae bacterium]
MADSDIARILRSDGPALSGDLLLKLQESGLSAEAARKRLSRGSADVAKLKGLVFPKGARFFYHVDDFGSERYWAALVDAIDVASPAYSAAIGALRAHGGIVPRQYFPIVSGAPIRQRKQIGSDTVLSRLTAVGLLEELVIHDVAYVSLGANGWFGGPISGWKNRLFVQEIMLLAVADWARKLSMVSFNSVAIRNLDGELPKFGTHAFDLCGPSYLQPMVRRGSGGGPKPGFLVCDAFVGEIDEAGVASFLRKCETS